ncbi:OsmC family protein [Streptomyces sp. W16]|uniref:OsmC family protein n=1 Tax=Streptomyces sp. W16 TaxID=3076631 RepID=UPI00295B3924|nr:OsmC family protein [Streptomyces sp. W16]MDV9169000.1 OsmC family protein [Streptomyces sp. W16]
MAVVRIAHTIWEGDVPTGKGVITFDSSGIPDQPVTWASRSQEANGKTSPEELIAAAHTGCYSMALANGLARAGHPPTRLRTTAEVGFSPRDGITGIALTVVGAVPGLGEAEFVELAEDAKANCPVSQALKAVPITLKATLEA